jgi:hypothetical protein
MVATSRAPIRSLSHPAPTMPTTDISEFAPKTSVAVSRS